MEKMEIKNAATVILLRGSQKNPEVLMGQRGKNASFMPNKFVFLTVLKSIPRPEPKIVRFILGLVLREYLVTLTLADGVITGNLIAKGRDIDNIPFVLSPDSFV